MLLLLPQLPEVPHPDPAAYVRLHRAADAALSAGAPAEARRAFEGCLELYRENATVAYGLACSETLAGNGVAALDWLERAADWGYADAAVAEWDEDLTAIRATPRFDEILERMRALADDVGVPSPYRVFDDARVPFAMDAAIDDGGELVAVALSDGKILLLDAETGHRLAASPTLGSKIWAVTFQPGTRTLAALTWEGELFLWAVDPGADERVLPRVLGKLPGEPQDGFEFFPLLQFDPTGERVLVGTTARGALLVSLDGDLSFPWGQPGRKFTPQLTWSDEGREIATWSRSEVVFRDGRTGKLTRRLEALSEVASVAYQSGGNLIATGHRDTCVRFWDRSTLELVREPEIVFPPDSWIEPESDFPLSMNCARFSSDGRYLAVSTAEMVVLLVFESSSGQLVHVDNTGAGRSGEPMDLYWSPDGQRIWLAYVSGGMSILSVQPFTEERRLTPWLAGRLPRGCPAGRGVTSGPGAVTGVDTNTGSRLWCYSIFGRVFRRRLRRSGRDDRAEDHLASGSASAGECRRPSVRSQTRAGGASRCGARPRRSLAGAPTPSSSPARRN